MDTWSRSRDTNSLNSSGFVVQNSYDIAGQYGPSDFDARHRFIISVSYLLPFTRHALTRGWQVAAVVQSQSGNPVNIVTSNSSLNSSPNTVRPDVTGPVTTIGDVDRWFDPSVFVPVNRFGMRDAVPRCGMTAAGSLPARARAPARLHIATRRPST